MTLLSGLKAMAKQGSAAGPLSLAITVPLDALHSQTPPTDCPAIVAPSGLIAVPITFPG